MNHEQSAWCGAEAVAYHERVVEPEALCVEVAVEGAGGSAEVVGGEQGAGEGLVDVVDEYEVGVGFVGAPYFVGTSAAVDFAYVVEVVGGGRYGVGAEREPKEGVGVGGDSRCIASEGCVVGQQLSGRVVVEEVDDEALVGEVEVVGLHA